MTDAPAAARRATAAATRLRRLVLALGLGWAIAFPLLGLGFRLQMFADGSIFSYAVAATDSWAFHWSNISGRVTAWLYSYLLPQAYVGATADAAGGVFLYGLLHFLAPLLSLIATRAADRTPGRAVLGFAAAATALCCPLVFGYPTEMWISMACFWPALALCLSPGGGVRLALTGAALLALVLSHEAGVIWAVVIVGGCLMRGAERAGSLRLAAVLAFALVVWGAVKLLLPPDPYVASVLGRNAWNLFDLRAALRPLPLVLMAALAGYGLGFLAASRAGLRRPALAAAGVTSLALAVWWAGFDTALHASDRYYIRTLLLGAMPLAGLAVMLRGRLVALARLGLGAVLVVTLVHLVETAKFIAGWSGYLTEIAALAEGEAADPALGDPEFVSAARISPEAARLGWNSTTPFLSVLVAPGMAPKRLVVDPTVGYFWFSCAVATANATRPGAVPAPTRDLVRRYTCLHR